MRVACYPDAERSLIGAALISAGQSIDSSAVQAADFFDLRHRSIWAALARLRVRRAPIDPVTVEAELGPELAERVGGLGYLAEMVAAVPAADNAAAYAERVAHAALDRRLRIALSELAESEQEGAELHAEAYRRLSAFLAVGSDSAAEVGELVGAAVRDLAAAMQRAQEGLPATLGIPTGYAGLDRLLGGIQPGAITIIAGRPSMGKSSLARSIADSANAAGSGVHIFSLEDARRAYCMRLLADYSRVELQAIRGVAMSAPDWTAVVGAGDMLHPRRGWLLDDTAVLSSSEIALRARRHKETNRTGLVIVDYIQRVREPNARERKDHLDTALDGLIDLARREEIAVLLVSQLSRACEAREDKRPLMSDLRESGELEQAADAVLMLYRDEVYTGPNCARPGKADLIIAKNKHGRIGSTELQWDARTATFREMRI